MSNKAVRPRKKPTAAELVAKGHLTLPEVLGTLARAGVYLPSGARTLRHLQHKGVIDAPVRVGVDERRRNVAFYSPRAVLQIIHLVQRPARQWLTQRFLDTMQPVARLMQYANILLERDKDIDLRELRRLVQQKTDFVSIAEVEKLIVDFRTGLRAAPVSEVEEAKYVAQHVPYPVQVLRVLFPDQTREELITEVLGWFGVIHQELVEGRHREAAQAAGLASWFAAMLLPWFEHSEVPLPPVSEPSTEPANETVEPKQQVSVREGEA